MIYFETWIWDTMFNFRDTAISIIYFGYHRHKISMDILFYFWISENVIGETIASVIGRCRNRPL